MNHNVTGNNSSTAGSRSSTQFGATLQQLELGADNVKSASRPSSSTERRADHDMISPVGETETRGAVNPLRTYLLKHPDRGNGVFASSDIRAGTVIEDSPVLVITRQQWDDGKMDDCVLGSYGFCWRNGGMGIGLGLGTSSSPNI